MNKYFDLVALFLSTGLNEYKSLKHYVMWATNTIWFEIAIVSIMYLLGHIFLGHFEERGPKWKKLLKYVLTVIIVVAISVSAGRTYALIVLGATLIPVFYVHAIMLPKKGINGWTGEPKGRYYEFRGWSKDIFRDEKKHPI